MIEFKRGSITLEFDVYYTHEKSNDIPEGVYVDEVYFFDGTEVRPDQELFRYIARNFTSDIKDEVTNED